MATPDQLRAMITAVPFQPFLIRMTGGRQFVVRHPENASCGLNGRALTVHDREGMHLVEMLLVEVMEPLGAPSTPSGPSGSDGNGG